MKIIFALIPVLKAAFLLVCVCVIVKLNIATGSSYQLQKPFLLWSGSAQRILGCL